GERKQDNNMVKSDEQVLGKLSSDATRPLCGFGLVSDVVGLLETCGLNPPSKPEEACRLASQKSDNLNMVISWLKKMKKGRPKNQLIRGMGLFHKLKKSKRRASSKHKSYRMRAEASVGLSTAGGVSAIGGENGTLVPSISTTMKGLSLPRESNSKVAQQIWELGKDLGTVFIREDRKVTNHIKEMETRDRR
ncbi:hypothetical protein Ancab_023095, partial [Ancistrocladus abbreviatus]